MTDEKSTSSTIGSVIGSAMSSLLQVRLLANKDVVDSIKRLHLSNLKVRINAMQNTINREVDNVGSSTPYKKTLLFEGHQVPYQARDFLFSLASNAGSYDELTPSMKRLVWWIVENDPYVNAIASPPPSVANVRANPNLYILAGGVVAGVVAWYFTFFVDNRVALPIFLVITLTLFRMYHRRPQDVEPDEWSWLQAYA